MREEDLDWAVYCLIGEKKAVTRGAICDILGEDPGRIEESLSRLERNLLIERSGEEVRHLTVGESIVKCQAKYQEDSPIYIENGIIKVKPKWKRMM
ncbi:MAG TPA: MarR family transcriptional regulator [Methanomicrobiales archaeon]|nr:MarR family transcriptional regulator [Methanomicrobiales archaeon]